MVIPTVIRTRPLPRRDRRTIAPLSRRARTVVTAACGVVGVGALDGGVRLLVEAEALGAEESWIAGCSRRRSPRCGGAAQPAPPPW